MTRFDFSPLFRSTIGFDRMAQLLESALDVDEVGTGYPPYNIEKSGDDKYRITLAVAGFTGDELDLQVKENTLTVSGKKADGNGDRRYLHRGIAARDFRRVFQLTDYVKVVGANLDNGLLHIDLAREVPEEMKPRKIEIGSGGAKTLFGKAKKLIDDDKAA
jgi:molecular chaperone IbpA